MKKVILLSIVLFVTHSSYGYMWWIIGPNQDNTSLATELTNKVTKAEKSVTFASKTVQILQSLGEMYALVENAERMYKNVGNYAEKFKNLKSKNWLGSFVFDPTDPRTFSQFGIKPKSSGFSDSLKANNEGLDALETMFDKIDSTDITSLLQDVVKKNEQGRVDHERAILAEMSREKAQEDDEMNNPTGDKTDVKLGNSIRNLGAANVSNHRVQLEVESSDEDIALQKEKLRLLRLKTEAFKNGYEN